MRSLIAFVLMSQSVLGSTWTIHGFRDNWMNVTFSGPAICYPVLGGTICGGSWQATAGWDWKWDQLFPLQADSGWSVSYVDGAGNFSQLGGGSGYSDVYTLFSGLVLWPLQGSDDSSINVSISGGAPDYSWGDFLKEPILPDGEYWIDFSSIGKVRISTAEPDDFGKWAWDGSINPNYVAPLKTKGHKKH